MATASDLPIELHAEIIKGLHHFKDRRTLLSAALVSKEWCNASQRVLFGTFTDHRGENLEQEDRAIWTHIRFLETIAEYPQRLGPLVRSYAQASMACNPAASLVQVSRMEIFDLWNLTAEALPAMINLKHLYFEPGFDSWPAADDWISSYTLLHSFNFQLETLTWKSYYHPRNGFSDFLATQNNLIHLENGEYPDQENLTWLEDGVCPHLISISGGFNSLAHVARLRKIIAWKWYTGTNEGELVRKDESALYSLMYLSAYDYKFFRNIVGPVDLNIILLELSEESWKRSVASLANMPSLRVVVFFRFTYGGLTDEEITRSAVECFRRLPSLEYIIQRAWDQSGNEYRYTKLSLAPDSTDDIVREELRIDYDVGAVWWTVYKV